MNILFSSYHAYLSKAAYEAVMRELQRRGVSSTWLQMYGSPFDELNRKIIDGVRNTVRTEELHLDRVKRGKLPHPIAAIHNWSAIRNFVCANRFTAVVVSSDTGGVSIRMLQEICGQQRIPVFVLLTVPSTAPNRKQNLRRSWPGFLRAITVQPDYVGHYLDATVLVDSRATQDTIIASGVAPDRCIVTGNPTYDSIESHSDERTVRLTQSLGLDPGKKIILYVTEVLEEVFDAAYIARIRQELADAARSLPLDFVIVCKPHPRESKQELEHMQRHFAGDRFVFTTMSDNNLLLAGATLVVGHFSSMLLQAIMCGTPVLSIQIQGEQVARSVFGPSQDFAVRSWVAFRAAFHSISHEPSTFFQRLQNAGHATLDALGIPADKLNASRVADILTNAVPARHAE